MDARLEIDRIACDGHGACAEVLPERIALDDWGYPILLPGPLPASMVELARLAIETCPVRALRLRGLTRGAGQVDLGAASLAHRLGTNGPRTR